MIDENEYASASSMQASIMLPEILQVPNKEIKGTNHSRMTSKTSSQN